MINRQAEIISKLNDALRREAEVAETYREQILQFRRAGLFYLALQKAILDNPILQSEWQRFLAFVKLAEQDEKLKVEPLAAANLKYYYTRPQQITLSDEEKEVLKLNVPDVFESWYSNDEAK